MNEAAVRNKGFPSFVWTTAAYDSVEVESRFRMVRFFVAEDSFDRSSFCVVQCCLLVICIGDMTGISRHTQEVVKGVSCDSC